MIEREACTEINNYDAASGTIFKCLQRSKQKLPYSFLSCTRQAKNSKPFEHVQKVLIKFFRPLKIFIWCPNPIALFMHY
jgi:hypothetical protein